MQFIRLSLMLLILPIFLNAEENVGFLMNQKYICLNLGMLKDNKIIPIMSKEDVLKYPIRFYVDDKRVLRTDGKMNNIYFYDNKNQVYVGENTVMNLGVEDGKRFLSMTTLKGDMKGILIIYGCSETDNWTLN